MIEEVIETRRLITKAESYILSSSADNALCERAKTARSIVHENADPKTALRGIKILEELIREMDANNIEGFEKLQKKLSAFKKNSRAWQESRPSLGEGEVPKKPSFGDSSFFLMNHVGTGPAKMDTIHSELIHPATDILNELKRNWRIGPYFVPLHPKIKTPNKVELEMAFSKWYDMTISHVDQCIEILSQGREEFDMRGTWMGRTVGTFKVLMAACQLALEANDQWAPPLIRVLIWAAHLLRQTGGSGKHGPDRLGAKLNVGKLIGDFSQYDLDSAFILADLTIESISFSRSQVLYAQERNPEALEILIDRWHQDRHPMYRDIVAQAYIFKEKESKARKVLCEGKKYLQTPQTLWHSTSKEKLYSEHLEDNGYIPTNDTTSIVHSEYLEAKKTKLPCLIYLVRTDISWPEKYIDQGYAAERLREFKEALQNEHICGYFLSPDDLAGQVAADVGREMERDNVRKQPEDDPYPRDQERELRLIDDLESSDQYKAKRAINVLSKSKPVWLIHTLKRFVIGSEEYLAEIAIDGLAEIASIEACNAIVSGLLSKSFRTRKWAAFTIGELALRGKIKDRDLIVNKLTNVIDNPSENIEVLDEIGHALCKIDGQEALTVSYKVLHSDRMPHRLKARLLYSAPKFFNKEACEQFLKEVLLIIQTWPKSTISAISKHLKSENIHPMLRKAINRGMVEKKSESQQSN